MKGKVTYGLFLLLFFFGVNTDIEGQSLDYLNDKNWFALPDMQDAADAVPQKSGLYDNQWRAEADVFYIHPTTYYRRLLSNDGL